MRLHVNILLLLCWFIYDFSPCYVLGLVYLWF